jgi:hypothetical protein
VAPKPSYIRQQHASNGRASPLPSSSALQGAALAFGPATVKANASTVSASHNPSASAGALLAANTASWRKQQQQQQQQHVPPPQTLQEHPLFSRGRQLTTEKSPVSVAVPTSLSPPPLELRPHAPRSTSAVAAVAASARTSPIRRPEIKRNQGSYLRQPEQGEKITGMSKNNTGDALRSLQQTAAALAGAKASMIPATSQVQSFTGDKPKGELNYLSNLVLPPKQPLPPISPSFSGTTAAVAATRNAASVEARKRALSTSQESSPGPPSSRYYSTSPQPIEDTPWPRLKVTPPQTDSESEPVRHQPDAIARPLAAPIPVRPSRAAVVAHEAAFGTSPSTPTVDARDARVNMTASSLADAMVAGSLAAQHTGSRRGSPATKKVPPPVPRRRSQSVGPLHGAKHLMHFPGMRSDAGSQTPKLKPLPAKPMRHTLRSSPDREEPGDEKKRGRRHWRRHPNMHHEGDRRRWRDKITERERKRYEGVWAANRGLLLDYDLDYLGLDSRSDGSPASDLVVNVIARDIWERSRLPRDVLEEIWDLVAQPAVKTLNREEFVVGLWLIDQRLKGRKLPVKVSQSVWSSVRHTQGVKISNKPLQK